MRRKSAAIHPRRIPGAASLLQHRRIFSATPRRRPRVAGDLRRRRASPAGASRVSVLRHDFHHGLLSRPPAVEPDRTCAIAGAVDTAGRGRRRRGERVRLGARPRAAGSRGARRPGRRRRARCRRAGRPERRAPGPGRMATPGQAAAGWSRRAAAAIDEARRQMTGLPATGVTPGAAAGLRPRRAERSAMPSSGCASTPSGARR